RNSGSRTKETGRSARGCFRTILNSKNQPFKPMNLKTIFSAVLASLLLALPAMSQIKAGRAIQVTIQGVPAEERARIDGVYRAAGSGLVNMPFTRQVRAAGMMPDALQTTLQNLYSSRQIYRNPTIQVIASRADTIDEQVVHVGGQ